MNDSPLYKARQAEMAKRNKGVAPSFVAEKNDSLETEKEQSKAKSKKKVEAEVEVEVEVPVQPEVQPEPVKESFPPVLENKAIQPEEVKETTHEDEEIL
jgi:hypothetical protein